MGERWGVARAGRRAAAWICVLVLAVAALSAFPPAALAHGLIDQQIAPLSGATSTPCDRVNFPGSVVVGPTKDLRQEFVPSVAGLTGVDLCFNILTPGTAVAVNLRAAGAGGAFNPGPVLDSASRTVGTLGVQYVHLDFSDAGFAGEAPTIAGTKYVLEVPASNTSYQWLTTCGTATDPGNATVPIAPCSPGDPDRYPAGKSNFELPDPQRIGDFGFRTLLGHPANLTGAITSIGGTAVLCPGTARTIAATVSNSGDNATASFTAGFYLSSDATITTADTPLGSQTVPSAPGASSVVVTLANTTIPSFASGRAYVGLIVDAEKQVAETNENDNTASSPVAVFCGHASFGALSLTADATDVPPGAYRVPLSSVPLEAIGFATTGTESSPTFGFALSGTAFAGLPTFGFFAGAPLAPLLEVHLSEIRVRGGWHQYLIGSQYENTPEQEVTFGDLVALAPPVPLGDVDFANSPIRGITLGGMATSPATLSQLSATGPGGVGWCAFLGGQGYDCATYGIDPASTTLLDLDLLGVRATVPWASMPFRSMDLSRSALLTLRLSQLRLGQTPLRVVPISAIGSASTFVSCGSCQTLGDAEAQGAIVDGPTVAQLIAALEDPAASLGETTLGDYLMGVLRDRGDWPVAALGLDQAPLYASSGHTVKHHVLVPSAGEAPLVDPKVSVVPPPGALLVPGTSRLVYAGDTRSIAEPLREGAKLTWSLSGADGVIVSPGTTLELQYTLAPGLELSVNGSLLSAAAEDQFGSVAATPVENAAPLRVSDAEHVAGQGNDAADSAPVLAAQEKLIGHVESSSDVDWYKLPLPKGSDCDLGGSGAVQAGCRVTVSLTVLGDPDADLDLAIWAPGTTSAAQGSPTFGFPTFGFSVDDDTSEVNASTQAAPETVQDFPTFGFPTFGFPTFGFPTFGFSATAGTSDERVDVVAAAGQTGYFGVEVWGRNGSSSDRPYVLSVTVAAPAQLKPCTQRAYGTGGVAGAAPALPDDFTTLILVNEKRMGDVYGAGATAAMLSELRSFATRPEVNGVVYPIESDAAVAQKLVAWDQGDAACDVSKANEVVSAISARIAAIKQPRPGLDTVIIVGSDEIFPHVRIPDRAALDVEDAYVHQLDRSTGHTAITGAANARYFLSDDAYATDQPFFSDDHLIFVPRWTVSRLVETPAQIQLRLNSYVASGGLADPPSQQTALVTGYDFVKDGAEAAAAPQRARLGDANVAMMNCDTWTKADLQAALFGPAGAPSSTACLTPTPAPAPPPDLVSLNGHADNFRFQPPAGSALLTTADVPPDFPAGRVVFSVGCHFGLNLPDSIGSGTEVPAALKDWAETLNAIVVGNLGYGYGDTTTVALSEKLMQLFSERLDGSRTVGEAFRDAKREFWLGHFGMYAGFDEKALQELVLYGLPSFRIAETGGVSASAGFTGAPQPLQTDLVTGLQSRPFDSGTIAYDAPTTTPFGTIYSIGGDTLTIDRRPIVPQTTFDVTNTDASKPGYRAAGLFLTGSESTIETDFDPVIARAEVDKSRSELRSVGMFPVAPAAVTYLGDESRLLLWPAKFVSTSTTGGTRGELSRATREIGTIYYTNVDAPKPRILTVDADRVDATHLRIEARTSGGANAVKRVGVLLGGTFGDLQQASPGETDRWLGTLTVPADVNLKNVLVEAVSAAGVGYWGNNGAPLEPTDIVSDERLLITPDGTKTNGWYTGTVSVTVTAPAGYSVQYSLDGSAYRPYAAPVLVSGTAHHIFRARATRTTATGVGEVITSSEQILIDSTAPVVSVTSPVAAASYDLNSTVTPSYACTDAGSGVMSCSGPATVDTSTPGTHTYTVTAFDVAGNRTDQPVTYTVRPDTTAPAITITNPVDGVTYPYNQVVKAAYSCADDGGSGLATCQGPVANGANVDMSVGPHAFTVTASDNAGNTSSRTVTYTVAGNSFEGFFSPISNPPALNTVTSGNTAPFKFRVFGTDGKEVTSTAGFAFGWRTIACSSPFADASPDPLSPTATSNPPFRYDAGSKFFVFNAQTAKSWSGYCRRFIVTLPDKTTRTAYLKLVK